MPSSHAGSLSCDPVPVQQQHCRLCDFGSAKPLVRGEPNVAYICLALVVDMSCTNALLKLVLEAPGIIEPQS